MNAPLPAEQISTGAGQGADATTAATEPVRRPGSLPSKERFIGTGFRKLRSGGYWHLLVALHRRWRLDFVRPAAKPGYRRLYIGPIEIEWSWS